MARRPSPCKLREATPCVLVLRGEPDEDGAVPPSLPGCRGAAGRRGPGAGAADRNQVHPRKLHAGHVQDPARDGTLLYTIVYTPKDQSQAYPILLLRTPYGIGPYAEDGFRGSLGPNKHFAAEKYIFAYQDVRGCYMSEGVFDNMRPQLAKPGGPKDIDESTDTYDTIDWLVKNVANNSGKVGQYGISYPGFYTSAGMVNAHSALKASSPQAPIADWFFDDFFHHGAFFLPHAFNFFSRFGKPRPAPTTERSRAATTSARPTATSSSSTWARCATSTRAGSRTRSPTGIP